MWAELILLQEKSSGDVICKQKGLWPSLQMEILPQVSSVAAIVVIYSSTSNSCFLRSDLIA